MVDTPYPLGALPPIAHPSAHRFRAHPLAGAPRPAAFDALVGADIPVRDQGQTSSCVGNATAEYLETLHNLAGEADLLVSAAMPWCEARSMEGSLADDTGCYPHDALDATRRLGICLERLFPLTPANIAQLPSQTALDDAAPRAGISFQQCADLDELLGAMGTLRVPGLIGIAVYREFFAAGPDGRVAPWSGAIVGYHALLVRGYDDSSRTIRLRNSWGPSWGDHGECVLSYEQAQQAMSEGWVAQLPTQPTPTPVPDDADLAAWDWVAQVAAWVRSPGVTRAARQQEAAVVIAELGGLYGGGGG